MPTLTVDDLIEQIRQLSPEERGKVHAALVERPPLPPEEEAFLRELAAEGIITRPKPAPLGHPLSEPFEPIVIEGEPLSETIIMERR
jgi:hypothetical protein